PLRGRPARADRGKEEGPCSARSAGGKRRRQGDRPDGCSATQPENRRRRGDHRTAPGCRQPPARTGKTRSRTEVSAASPGECRMSIQLPLPGDWPRNATWPDPLDQLRQLEKDKLDAKYEIRQVLERYREKYRISAKQVNQAVWGYVDDLLD